MGNQEESQRERGLNLEDQEIVGTMVKLGIRRNIARATIIIKEINQKRRRKMS